MFCRSALSGQERPRPACRLAAGNRKPETAVKILTRYILGEVLGHALIGVALFTFVVFMRDVGRLMELVVRASAPALSVAEVFLFTLPTALTVTIPMGVLVGILLGLSRLAADTEITAMRASGVGTGRFVRIVAFFAVAAWLLAAANNLWLAPRSAAALANLQAALRNSQASYEIQPRIFYEDFRNYVLYVQDVSAGGGVALWKGIFLADVSTPGAPKITLARSGVVAEQAGNTLRLHLEDGATHEVQPRNADQYIISTFAATDTPIQLPQAGTRGERESASTAELDTRELWRRGHAQPGPEARWYLIEFHRRLALPTACLVLALVGIPLGLSARKGGKSAGFVLAIVLVFLYYFVSLAGLALARQGRVSPALGVWLANGAFLLGGMLLLGRVEKRPVDVGGLRAGAATLLERFRRATWLTAEGEGNGAPWLLRLLRRFGTRFPQLLDDYVLREFVTYVGLVLAAFLLLTLLFTFFEILRDVLRNAIAWRVVGEYLLMVLPSMLYLMTPMSVLIAVLVTFGLMARNNEITAMKATGISIYRVVLPVLVICAVLAGALFAFDQLYLPRFNRRQETLFNRIKGRPAQTYMRPNKWIFGEHHDMYYYEFHDSDRNEFGNITVFEFDPQSFAVTKRIYAAHARWSALGRWVFEQGWVREFRGPAIADFRTFDVATFPELNEAPQYFHKQVKQSQEMNYAELQRYIHELQQSGFDVVRLRVQLQKKLAFPLITLVMAVLAIPFSLSAGRRGALTGVAVAITIAVVYWVTAGLFEALGNTGLLPAILAAWAPDVLFALGGGYLVLKVPT